MRRCFIKIRDFCLLSCCNGVANFIALLYFSIQRLSSYKDGNFFFFFLMVPFFPFIFVFFLDSLPFSCSLLELRSKGFWWVTSVIFVCNYLCKCCSHEWKFSVYLFQYGCKINGNDLWRLTNIKRSRMFSCNWIITLEMEDGRWRKFH